jgi:uncharacterized protein YndB with AHSA1/START domain
MKTNDDYAQFPAPGEIRLLRTLPGPIERLWQYLTDPEKRSRWFAGGPMELKAGGKMELLFQHKNIAPQETPPPEHAEMHANGWRMPGTVLRCDPPRVLSYTFDENSDVTFELIPQDNENKSVLLILTHRARGEDVNFLSGYASGWHTHFAILIALLEDAPTPPFWATHARLKAHYQQQLPPASS